MIYILRFQSGTSSLSQRVELVHFFRQGFQRVYGPRISGSFLWGHGFILRLAPEVMNAYLPNISSLPDIGHRVWVFGTFIGIRKNFNIYKNWIGYTEGLYNPIQKTGHNIYGDQVTLRLGIELKLKKRAKIE